MCWGHTVPPLPTTIWGVQTMAAEYLQRVLAMSRSIDSSSHAVSTATVSAEVETRLVALLAPEIPVVVNDMLGGLCGEVCVPLWGSSGGSGGRLLFRALLHVLDLTPRDASSDDIPLSMWERIILPSLHRGGEVGDLALACLRRLLHPSPPVWLSTAVIPLCFQSISLDVAAVGLPLEPACACIVALLTLQAPPPDFVMELLPLVTTFLRESNSSQRAVVSISVVQALVAFARDASRCASHLAPVICATLQQCVEGLLGNGKQAELDGYSLMCQLCTSLPGFTDTQAFWLATRSGLLHGDAVIRKQSQFLLREGLHARGFSVPTPTALPSLPSDPLDGHDFWLDTRSRVASQLLSLPLNWELLLSLLEAMEDFPVHLVDEVWPHHARLFPVFIPSDEGIIVPPDVSHGLDHVPFVWASIALHRALNNHARRVKHKLLLQYLRLPPPYTGATTPVGLTVPFQFASTQLIAFLDDGNVFKTARHELMDCVLSYFTRYMEALDSSCRPLFLASYLHTLHSGFTCVSLVRPLMSVFTQALARSVSRSAPLPALSVTSAEDLIALVNHISLSYTDSVQRAALPCALDCLLRFSTPNDLPPLCIAKVLLSFPRHLLAASKDWIKTWFSLVRPVEFLESVRATITTAISRDSTADVSSSTQLGTLLVLATLCGDACMPILDTFVGVMVNMFVEVYMPSTLQQVLLSTLSSFVLLSHVLNPGCPFTTTAMREVDDAVSSIFQLRLHSALSISSATDSASSHPISLALCLDVASSLLQCAESVVIPRLLAACRDALSASLRQLVMPPTASTDSVRSRVSHCIQSAHAMQTFAALMDSIGSVMSLPGDGILTLETLAVLFRSELTRPRGAADPVLPVASNPDLWECDTERASVDPVAGTTMSGQFDDHALLNWGRLISRFQSWKWSTLAAAVVCLGANGTLASVGTDVIGDLLCTSLDAITVVPSDSVPSVVICQRELLVAYYSRREVSCEGLLAAVDGIMNTIAKVSLPIPLVKAISSLLFHIDLIRRPELGPGLLSHGLAFIQRLDRPPQLAGQIVTFAACTAFRNIALAHSASAAVAGKGIISILAFVPLLQWLCTCKETPLMGEEYVLCDEDERRALLEQVSSGIIPEPEAALIRSVLSGMSKGVQTLAWDADAGLPKGAGALIRLQALCALDHVYYRDTGIVISDALVEFVEALIWSLVQGVAEHKYLVKETWTTFGSSLRTWQAIGLLIQRVRLPFAQRLFLALRPHLVHHHPSPVKTYIDSVLALLFRKFPLPLIDEWLIPALAQLEVNKQVFTSRVLVGTSIVRDIVTSLAASPSPALAACCVRLVNAILPWTLCSYGSVRALAQQSVAFASGLYVRGSDDALITLSAGIQVFTSTSPSFLRMQTQLVWELNAFQPTVVCSLAGIVSNAPDDDGDLVPASVADAIIKSVNDSISEVRELDETAFGGQVNKGPPPRIREVKPSVLQDIINFQKKRTPWEDVAWSSDVLPVDIRRKFEGLMPSIDGAVPLSSLVLTALDASGRPCQPVIVFASLVNRPANLGGLARTCEVFRAQCLVVEDLAVKEEKLFKNLSVSAYEWTHMEEQDVAGMTQFIKAKKAEGYTIVGLEQAQCSVPLQHATFPDNIMLVLGREKEGVPIEVIQLLDLIVEIPQLGVIRSLNVHVSASMLLWEYTRQRLLRAGAK